MKQLRVGVLTPTTMKQINRFIDDLQSQTLTVTTPHEIEEFRKAILIDIKHIWRKGYSLIRHDMNPAVLAHKGVTLGYTEQLVDFLGHYELDKWKPIIVWNGVEVILTSIPEIYYYEPFTTTISSDEELALIDQRTMTEIEQEELQAQEELRRCLTQFNIASSFSRGFRIDRDDFNSNYPDLNNLGY